MDSIRSFLQESRSIRQSRVDELHSFLQSQEETSTTNTEILSPFQQKYRLANSKLHQLQRQLDDLRIDPPDHIHPHHHNDTHETSNIFPIHTKETHIESAAHPLSHTQSEQLLTPLSDAVSKSKQMTKSQSTSTLPSTSTHTHHLENSHHSNDNPHNDHHRHSASVKVPTDSATSSSDVNPYSFHDIHPTLLGGNNPSKSLQKQTTASSLSSIRSKLLNETEQLQHDHVRTSLLALESKSDLLQNSNSSHNLAESASDISSKRKTPRKLTCISIQQPMIRSPTFSPPSRSPPPVSKSKSLFVRPSVSFAEHDMHPASRATSNTISNVRKSILMQQPLQPPSETAADHDQDEQLDTVPALSPLRSLLRSPTTSPRALQTPRTRSVMFAFDRSPDRLSRRSISPSTIRSPNDSVHDLMECSERTLTDKQGNIDTYRQSMLHQLNVAQHRRNTVLHQRHKENMAMAFWKDKMRKRIMKCWQLYTEREIEIGYIYRQRVILRRCWNEWIRMLLTIRTIEKRRYLRIWRACPNPQLHHQQMQKLLQFPTKSRWMFLKIICLIRLHRHSFAPKKKHKVVMDRLYKRYYLVMLHVLFNTWRTLAQQKNVAAFKIVQMINAADDRLMVRTLRRWRMECKQKRTKRKDSYAVAKKLHLQHVFRRCFRDWMNVFIQESTTKMALLHWCQKKEQHVFAYWRKYAQWSIASQASADARYRRYVLHRYFTFWLDEFIRMQNERQWRAWREANKAAEEQVKAEMERTQSKVNASELQNDSKKTENEKQAEPSMFSRIQSADHDASFDLFFPYCRPSGTQALPKEEAMDLLKISESNDGRLSYVKHCELQSILIPNYDESMAAKYNDRNRK